MTSTLPDSTMGDLMPLIAGGVVVLALVVVLGAFPMMREALRARTDDLREFVGAPPAPVAPGTDGAAESDEEATEQTPWGNLSLDIYDES